MVTRIILLHFVLVASLKGGVSIGMSFNEIQNIINQVENIVTENPPTEISNQPTQEIWDASTGSWVEQEINPVINGGGLVVNPNTGEIDHTSENVVTTPPTSIPEQPPTSDNNGETGGGGSSSSNVDTDDDVPTLLSIRSKIHTLQQEMVKQVEEVRGAERSVITNWETNETTSKRVDYGDLYAVLEKMVPDNTEEKNQISDKKKELEDVEDSESDQIDESLNNLETDITDYVSKFSPETAGSKTNTNFEINVAGRSFYLDPLNNTYTGGIESVSWQEIADWIKIVIGVVCVLIYFNNTNLFINDILDTLTKAPKSAPVSNISVFGNSLGTIALKVIKWSLISSLIVGTLAGTFSVLLESNVDLGFSSSVLNVIQNPEVVLLGDSEPWIMFAVSLFTDVLPLVAISGLTIFYYSQCIIARIVLLGKITFMQATT